MTDAPAPAARTAAPPPVLHGLAPVWSPRARLLVLGSFPSVASLQAQQYYAHPRNQFWPILSALWGKHLAHQLASPLHTLPYAERVAIALAHGVAIWDVYAQCVRPGSLDSAIRDAQLNDLPGLIARSQDLRVLAHNGGESARHRRITERLGHTVLTLPSTSPANASWSFERKLDAWRAAFEAAEVLKPLDSPPGR